MALVYWWAEENEVHLARVRRAAPGRAAAADRHRHGVRVGARGDRLRAPSGLEDVLINDDVDAYLERALEPVAV